MAKSSSFERQFKGGYFPMEHWDESTAVNGNEPSSPSTDKRRSSLAYNAPVHAFPGLDAKNDYDRFKTPGKPQIKDPDVKVASGGWELQMNPAQKVVTASVISKQESRDQGEGPKKIKDNRRY